MPLGPADGGDVEEDVVAGPEAELPPEDDPGHLAGGSWRAHLGGEGGEGEGGGGGAPVEGGAEEQELAEEEEQGGGAEVVDAGGGVQHQQRQDGQVAEVRPVEHLQEVWWLAG